MFMFDKKISFICYYNLFSGRYLAIITNLLRVNITSPGVNFIISPVFLLAFENEG